MYLLAMRISYIVKCVQIFYSLLKLGCLIIEVWKFFGILDTSNLWDTNHKFFLKFCGLFTSSVAM